MTTSATNSALTTTTTATCWSTEEGGSNADGSYLPDRSAILAYVNTSGTGPAIATLAGRKTPDPATVQGLQLYSLIDFRANETSFAYNTSGANAGTLSSRTTRTGDQTTYAYTSGQTTVAMPLARTWVYNLDTLGRVTRIDDPGNPADTTVLWTTDNSVSKVTQPNGQFVQYAYNANGFLTDKWDQLNNRTTIAYQNIAINRIDITGNWEPGGTIGHISRATSIVQPVGNTTGSATDYKWTFAYDAARDSQDQLVTITDPLGNNTSNSWNANGTLASTRLPANGDSITRPQPTRPTRPRFDELGRLWNALVADLRDQVGQQSGREPDLASAQILARRRADVKNGAGSQSAGSTSAVLNPLLPAAFGFAFENGSVLRTISGNTATISINPAGLVCATRVDASLVSLREPGCLDGWRRVGLTLSFDTNRGGKPSAVTGLQPLADQF